LKFSNILKSLAGETKEIRHSVFCPWPKKTWANWTWGLPGLHCSLFFRLGPAQLYWMGCTQQVVAVTLEKNWNSLFLGFFVSPSSPILTVLSVKLSMYFLSSCFSCLVFFLSLFCCFPPCVCSSSLRFSPGLCLLEIKLI